MTSPVRPVPVLLLLVACSAPAAPARTPVIDAMPADLGVEEHVFHESNRVRSADGVASLVEDPALTAAARAHARELHQRQVLDHFSLDPARRTLAQRLQIQGVRSYRRIGENLAAVHTVTSPAREIVRLWLRSPGHRANLLEFSFDRTGVGAVRADDGTWYVVQVYGAGIEPEDR